MNNHLITSSLISSLLLLPLTPMVHAQETPRTAFVHLFEWRWDDIAKECETFLGPKGFAAVQISPPNEHRLLLGRPWYERYQPISYKLTSHSGTRTQLVDMINRCHQASVKIYADAVINHMASCRPDCDTAQPQYGTQGIGGSIYQIGKYQFADLFDAEDKNRVNGTLGAYQPEHFHHECNAVSNWDNVTQVQHCELERLADLATEREDVQNTLANYLASLFMLGIDGLRIDAAKHLSPSELHAILEKAAIAAQVRIEGTNINSTASRSVLVFQEYIGAPFDREGAYGNGKVTEFGFGPVVAEFAMQWGKTATEVKGLKDQLQPSAQVVTFIDNHDNQRGHGGGGRVFAHKGGDGKNYGIRNNLPAYLLANVFMLAYPYGYPQVMSSYRFGDGEFWNEQNAEQNINRVINLPVKDDFQGPPHNGVHKSDLQAADYVTAATWTTKSVWVKSGTDLRNSCFDLDSKWMCEHRLRPIQNMVKFRNVTAAAWQVNNWWDNNNNQLAFGRGNLGFVIINAEANSNPNELGIEKNGWFQTGLSEGDYCDVIHSDIAQDKLTCLSDGGKLLPPIHVYPDGKAKVTVKGMDAVALHIQDKLKSDTICKECKRTVILIYGETKPGQDMFIRGGIDHDYANKTFNKGCSPFNYNCAIPIKHLNLKNPTTAPWKQGDYFLDWHGQEPNQTGVSHGFAQGTPTDWTTNQWPMDWGTKRTVSQDGYGEEPLNKYGQHYWMLDVEMDCSKTVDGWFEFKSYISNGPGWEGNIKQSGTPYSSINHFGKCGQINVFKRNVNEVVEIVPFK